MNLRQSEGLFSVVILFLSEAVVPRGLVAFDLIRFHLLEGIFYGIKTLYFRQVEEDAIADLRPNHVNWDVPGDSHAHFGHHTEAFGVIEDQNGLSSCYTVHIPAGIV